MFEIVAVTDFRQCAEAPLKRIRRISESGVSAIILREKGLEASEYAVLAQQAADVLFDSIKNPREGSVNNRSGGSGDTGGGSCDGRAELIIHTFHDAAAQIGCRKLHLPFSLFAGAPWLYRDFSVGVSVHSVEEARLAASLGASRLVAGHIFETDCKEGLAPRGIDFLAEICRTVAIPVYAIGGINIHNIDKVREVGAVGACLMSPFMRTDNVEQLTSRLLAAASDAGVRS
ncbi:MAG: thiamine phosphate synthase [Clostridiales Family XIII bacterium]|jgi:thiamine-phosphate pyrophosphorylase|nr:thiamine phosphate synthase [Clostridiales Family XIII bacterium]